MKMNMNNLNLVFIGDVDAGKSNLCGHLLYLVGAVDERTVEKLRQEAVENNRSTWVWSYIMDTIAEERLRGKTLDISRAQFETKQRRYTILDAPGHRQYVPNMIRGATQADVAILVISAKTGEFESGFLKGGQTRDHALLAKMMGIKRLVVVINKMDTVDWSQERYQEISDAIMTFLVKECQFSPAQIMMIPISAYLGINLIAPMPRETCRWYSGPSLIDFLDSLPPVVRTTEILRMPVSDRIKDSGNLYLSGKIEMGAINRGDTILVMPKQISAKVGSIMIGDTALETASTGDNIMITLTSGEGNDIVIGDVLCDPEHPIPVISTMTAQIKILRLPVSQPLLTAGYSAMLHLHTATRLATVMELMTELDLVSGKEKPAKPFARVNSIVTVKVSVTPALCAEKFSTNQYFGRFTLRDKDVTVGIGKILSLE
jgi:peptide chain release factor subunit 3